ncbi:type I toxin-antitoxin system SymE family toxin [Klebsiella aerogenes]|nr:type I toxin-antitoxin system SymE family toxin [Klebsiella aerogenes]
MHPKPSQHLKGDWLIEAGFGTRTFVTVKATEGCLVLIADNSE